MGIGHRGDAPVAIRMQHIEGSSLAHRQGWPAKVPMTHQGNANPTTMTTGTRLPETASSIRSTEYSRDDEAHHHRDNRCTKDNQEQRPQKDRGTDAEEAADEDEHAKEQVDSPEQQCAPSREECTSLLWPTIEIFP